MLGESLRDPSGVAGAAGDEPGLRLLPVATVFQTEKIVRPVTAECAGQRWETYEIHMDRTWPTASVEALHTVWDGGRPRSEGTRLGRVWGTNLHGWFESPQLRALVAAAGGLADHRPYPQLWSQRRQAVYKAMATQVAGHVNLDQVRRYLGL
ncbi:MAG: hypothetical protein WCL04_04185 [Verrucomicrobiota bacterium]